MVEKSGTGPGKNIIVKGASQDHMSPKAEKFIDALKCLCLEHSVMLSVSNYDALQVWDLEPDDEIIHSAGIDDKTKEETT